MDQRSINEVYTEMGQALIQTEECLRGIKDSDVTIVYLSSELEKKKGNHIVYGQCEKVPEKYRWAVPCDFTITIFEPNVERFTEEQMRILILHELLHVGIEKDGGEEKYSVREHDVEEFEEIINRYGMRWDCD